MGGAATKTVGSGEGTYGTGPAIGGIVPPGGNFGHSPG